ncbi:MAG: hypothetical protein H0X13_06500 [Ramlibacter sp.]|nr:hypothetical protein [Ramlibacter sp.]
MQRWKYLLLCPVLGAASFSAAACYTVYDRSDRVVYHAPTAPVDMSRPIHETLPAIYPGGHMIFDTAADCPEVVTPRAAANRSVASPLLTDERTARAMQLRHTVLASGVALVQPRDAAMPSGITVLSSTVVADRRAGRDTVITEMRNPPMTIVQSGDRVAVERDTRAMGAGPSR